MTGNNFQKDNYINDQFYFQNLVIYGDGQIWKHVWDDFDLKINFWNDYKYSDDWKLYIKTNMKEIID